MDIRLNFAFKLDALLAGVFVAVYYGAGFAGASLAPGPFAVSSLIAILVVHILIYVKILRPLKRFAKIADDIVDGDVQALKPENLPSQAFDDLHASFGKIAGSLLESRESIESYMKTISDMNKQLAEKVDSLSLLFSISKAMGSSLSIDGLVRTFLTQITDRLHLSGAMVLLYNDRNDMITVKDLLGFPPELFAKFRFFSDNKIIMDLFAAEDGIWIPDEAAMNLMKAEFETEAVQELHLFTPMRIKDHFVGIIILSEKRDREKVNEGEIKVVQALAGLATTAINNATLYERSESTKNELDRKVFNLMTLQQAGKVLSSTLNLDELITMAIDMFLETVWSNRGLLMLTGDESHTMEVKAMKGIDVEELERLKKDPAEAWVMTTLQKEKRPILAKELASQSINQSYSTMSRPLPFAVYIPLLKEGEL